MSIRRKAMDSAPQKNERDGLRGQIEVQLRSALYNAEELADDMLSYLLRMAIEELKKSG